MQVQQTMGERQDMSVFSSDLTFLKYHPYKQSNHSDEAQGPKRNVYVCHQNLHSYLGLPLGGQSFKSLVVVCVRVDNVPIVDMLYIFIVLHLSYQSILSHSAM